MEFECVFEASDEAYKRRRVQCDELETSAEAQMPGSQPVSIPNEAAAAVILAIAIGFLAAVLSESWRGLLRSTSRRHNSAEMRDRL